jgi:hypothetical protein
MTNPNGMRRCPLDASNVALRVSRDGGPGVSGIGGRRSERCDTRSSGRKRSSSGARLTPMYPIPTLQPALRTRHPRTTILGICVTSCFDTSSP